MVEPWLCNPVTRVRLSQPEFIVNYSRGSVHSTLQQKCSKVIKTGSKAAAKNAIYNVTDGIKGDLLYAGVV